MVRLLPAMFIIMICMYSCSPGNDEGNITLLKEVNKSLLQYNEATKISTANIISSLEYKTRRPETSERATTWLANATTIKKLTDSILLHIGRIKSDLIEEAGFDPLKEDNPKSAKQAVDHIFKEHKEGQLLHEKLALYKKDVLAFALKGDSVFQNNIRSMISITGTDMVSNENSFANKYFNTTALGAITMLNKIENDILTTENKLIVICHQQTAIVDEYDHYAYKAIISQSANIVKPGDNMQIFAGIAAFSIKAKPIVRIEGREIPLTPEAYAEYNFKASFQPGTYRVPVQIKYIDPAQGKEVIIKETIEYKVKSDQ